MRRGLSESELWTEEQQGEILLESKGVETKANAKEFFIKANVTAMLFLIGVYLFWNMVAGTMGFLMPFIYETIG